MIVLAAVDVFVSYAGRDRAWAEWVTWQLTEAGYRVVLDTRDWAAGENFVLQINDSLERADRVVALFSEAYFEPQRYTTLEWTSVVAGGERLVPLRVEDVTPPAVLKALVARDLHGLSEEQAGRVLLEAVAGPRGADGRPRFPGRRAPTTLARRDGLRPRLPGALPPLWNAPLRGHSFTGRDGMLVRLREQLCSGNAAVVQALHGMGGVGKTQLVVEYAHRFASDYDLVWWVDAEQLSLIGEQMAALGVAAGWVESDRDIPAAMAAVKAWLRGNDRWLLVFDNAEDPSHLVAWLPEGPGHVVITSRNPRWDQLAEPLEVDVFARAESVALLRRHLPTLREDEAVQLAAALGDLPLALAQAAAILGTTGMPVDEYMHLIASRAAEVLAEATPVSYPVSLAAAIRLATGRLAAEDEAAVQLLRLSSFFAPEPVPIDLFTAAPEGLLPFPLASTVGSALALRRSMGRIGRYGLARIRPEGMQLHRLTQAVVLDDLDEPQRQWSRAQAEALLAAVNLGDCFDPASWPAWARLLPHVLAADVGVSASPEFRDLACNTARYLLARGDASAALRFVDDLYTRWRDGLGPDYDDSLHAASILARAHRDHGQYAEARRLDADSLERQGRLHGQDNVSTLASAISLATDLRALGEFEQARWLAVDTLRRYRRVLGPDHPDTLTSANSLAANLRALGQVEQARDLNEDTLTRRRRSLGDEHPDTLASANSFAVDLYAMGEFERARQLHEDVFVRRRRVFGDDHPDTLITAHNLATDLYASGEFEGARRLHEDVLARRRRVLGEDHPDTLTSASSLAIDLYALEKFEGARQLHEDVLARRRRVLGKDHPDTLRSGQHAQLRRS